MANRRFAVHEIRHVIARMRLGESDRQIAKAGLMGRVKAGKLRLLAQDQGWLDKDAPLPANEVIERLTRKTSPIPRSPAGSGDAPPITDPRFHAAPEHPTTTRVPNRPRPLRPL